MRYHRTVALVAALTGLALLPGAARATDFYVSPGYTTSTPPANCSSSYACVYKDANFGGARALRTGSDSDWRNNTYENGTALNDSATSIFNRSTYTRRFFRDTGFGGHVLCIAPYRGIKDLRKVEWVEDYFGYPRVFSMNDRISGHSTHSESINNLHCNWRIT